MSEVMTQSAERRELVSFMAGGQEYCVDIMGVREIRGWTPATALPKAPPFVCGVINLRGAVLPIVDFACRFGRPPAKPSERHVIIVTHMGRRLVGLLVDAVSDILTVSADMIQPTPSVGSELVSTFVRGVLTIEGRMISLVSLDTILAEFVDEPVAA